MDDKNDPNNLASPEDNDHRLNRWLSLGAWILALGMVALAIYLGLRRFGVIDTPLAAASTPERPVFNTPVPDPTSDATATSRPTRTPTPAISPTPEPTNPPQRRDDFVTYMVQDGDSLGLIAERYGLEPKSVLWANYDLLNDNPDFLRAGMQLQIPPVDGVYYQWQGADSLAGVAAIFGSTEDTILEWPGNQIDTENLYVVPGTWIMIPGGVRVFERFVLPSVDRAPSVDKRYEYGSGACFGGYEGPEGSGTLIWPTVSHEVRGNTFWEGHEGVDLAVIDSEEIVFADAGVVVFAGWANGGYGLTVMIDHGNGIQTVYAHLSEVLVHCGNSGEQGQVLGLGGNVNSSMGLHLHFEVRRNGERIDPLAVLP